MLQLQPTFATLNHFKNSGKFFFLLFEPLPLHFTAPQDGRPNSETGASGCVFEFTQEAASSLNLKAP
jgi:hypothetical protein